MPFRCTRKRLTRVAIHMYNPQLNHKRKHQRKIMWYNSPWNANVKTNLGRTFLNIIDRCFPNGHPLHKIFMPGWQACDFCHSDQQLFHSKWRRREAILLLKLIFMRHSFPLNCRITRAHVLSVVAILESSRTDISLETFLKFLREVYPI